MPQSGSPSFDWWTTAVDGSSVAGSVVNRPPHRSWMLGRRAECEAVDRLLADVLVGQSRVLVLRGEAGVGKTALLSYVAEEAAGCRVARAAGVQSEMELPFAGLHQLCAPDIRQPQPDPRPPARCAAGCVRRAGRRIPEPLPGRPRGAESACRCGRGASAGVPRRRRAMARPRVRAGAGVRGAAPARREDRDGVRRSRAQPGG